MRVFNAVEDVSLVFSTVTERTGPLEGKVISIRPSLIWDGRSFVEYYVLSSVPASKSRTVFSTMPYE